VTVEFTAGQGGQTQRGFLIKTEGNNTVTTLLTTEYT